MAARRRFCRGDHDLFSAEPFQEPDAEIDPGIEENEAVGERIGEIGEAYFPMFEEEFPEFGDCDWCYDWKGGNALRSERSDEITALLAEYYELVQRRLSMARRSPETHSNRRYRGTRLR